MTNTNTAATEEHIQAFMSRRPKYTERHVRLIAADCVEDGIPFHAECADWHNPGEECSR